MPSVGDLPSSDHAKAFLAEPDFSGAVLLAVDMLVRGAIITAGIQAFSRPGSSASRKGLAGAAAIELFVLGYTLLSTKRP